MFRTAARGLFVSAARTVGAVGRSLLTCAAVVGLLSCGGGGGGDAAGTKRAEGVYTGFAPQVPTLSQEQALNWSVDANSGSESGGDGGIGAGGDGDGGVGAGGDFGQFRNALLVVKYPDGTPVGNGQALTDAATGMVTIVPRAGYQGPLLLELRGGNGATYYEEGKDAFVDFPAGQVIRAMVPRIDKNIGITPFSEAAYRLLIEGSTAERAANAAQPSAAEIKAANLKVLAVLNQQFPAALHVDDITRLPFIKSSSITANSIPIDARGRYGLVNGAFSKQAAMYNAGRAQPTLDAVTQLGNDLLDGVLDGMNGSLPAAAAAARTYDPNTLTGELSSALAEQSYRFGTEESKLALPRVTNFGNTRYEGYLFDASLTPDGRAIDTVAGWVGGNEKGLAIGRPFDKLPNEARAFGVMGNLGHGAVFFKANAGNSLGKVYVVGDNVNGELGLGTTNKTLGAAIEITLPGVVTHVAGGFAHTVARFADGSVYAWGDNSFGQLGTGTSAASTTPVRVSLPRGAVAVAATNVASYALLDDGSVYAWGSSGGFGLLGDGNKNSVSTTPAPVSALSSVVQITARDNDVAVLRKDGTVWHWGSFPADPAGFTAGIDNAPYVGGSPLPVQVTGLPAGVTIRKVLTEQGVFAALMSDGTVYEWGVYFDITAATILRDTEARRVLNLPPIRDMMPGGFIGYGVRAFDRLTAMGVDYRGGLWKIRGRVAEQYDPANPTQQRRPQGQAPRVDCASCHLFLNDWPLVPAAPTTTATCQPPASIHGSGSTSLIHAETECQMCHNPARNPPIPAFPAGWLACVKPTTLPLRSNPTTPAILTNTCTPAATHPFTPPGTVCASCHNSIIARPLNDPALNCAQPQSSALPSIRTTGTITRAVNDAVNGVITDILSGSSTADTTPTLSGSLSAVLASGQSLRVLRNGTAVGSATVSGTTWSYTDSGATNGVQLYNVRVEAGTTAFGATSNGYAITIDTVAPGVPAVTGVSDGLASISNGGSTTRTSLVVSGSLPAALAAGESVLLLRSTGSAGAVQIASLSPTGSSSWTFTDTIPNTAASYTYRAQAIDAALNNSALSPGWTVNKLAQSIANAVTITGVNVNGTSVAPVAMVVNNDATPGLTGTLQAGLQAGERVRVYRSGTSSLVAVASTVTGTDWTYQSPALASGTYTFEVRVEQTLNAALFGASGSVVDVIDVTPPATPTSLAALTSLAPYNNTANPNGDSPTAVLNPAVFSISNGGATSDRSPTLRVQLAQALESGGRFELTGGSALIARTSAQLGSATQIDLTDPVAINTPALGAPTASGLPVLRTYTLTVYDAQGNASGTRSIQFSTNYFSCSQARAQAANSNTTHNDTDVTPSLRWSAAGTAQCLGCHASPTAPGFVAAPPSGTRYWCRKS